MATAGKMDTDHQANGQMAETPLMLLAKVVIHGILFAVFTVIQITSTVQAVLGFLQTDIKVSPGMTASDAITFMQGNLDHNLQIAFAIGWAVQVALCAIAFPSDGTFSWVSQKFAKRRPLTDSLQRTALGMSKLKMGLIIFLIASDFVTDFIYVLSGHQLWPLGGGILLVGLLYPAGICFVNIYCGKTAFVSLESLIDFLRNRD